MSRFNRTAEPKINTSLPTTRRCRTIDATITHTVKPQPKIKPNDDNGNHNGNGNGRLTPKQALFVDEYLKDLNATQAAIRAGYSNKAPEVAGSILLSTYKVQQAVQKRRDELKASLQMDQEWVLNGYKKLIDYKLDEIYDDDGNILPISKMSENARFAACGMKVLKTKNRKTFKDGGESESETNMHELKFSDKKVVFDQVGKHLGMFKEEEGQLGNKFNFNAPVQINVGITDIDADD